MAITDAQKAILMGVSARLRGAQQPQQPAAAPLAAATPVATAPGPVAPQVQQPPAGQFSEQQPQTDPVAAQAPQAQAAASMPAQPFHMAGSGGLLNAETARAYLGKTNGDKDLARHHAKADGWQF